MASEKADTEPTADKTSTTPTIKPFGIRSDLIPTVGGSVGGDLGGSIVPPVDVHGHANLVGHEGAVAAGAAIGWLAGKLLGRGRRRK